MIPAFDNEGYLPQGEHIAGWQEIENRFGGNARRDWLLDGLHRALLALKIAGCHTAYIDGSFVTDKEEPGDFDGVWDIQDVDGRLLDPILLILDDDRLRQKIKYHGELFPSNTAEEASGRTFLEFFQTRADTGAVKGIIRINLDVLI